MGPVADSLEEGVAPWRSATSGSTGQATLLGFFDQKQPQQHCDDDDQIAGPKTPSASQNGSKIRRECRRQESAGLVIGGPNSHDAASALRRKERLHRFDVAAPAARLNQAVLKNASANGTTVELAPNTKPPEPSPACRISAACAPRFCHRGHRSKTGPAHTPPDTAFRSCPAPSSRCRAFHAVGFLTTDRFLRVK